jgi:hypothetical protein
MAQIWIHKETLKVWKAKIFEAKNSVLEMVEELEYGDYYEAHIDGDCVLEASKKAMRMIKEREKK